MKELFQDDDEVKADSRSPLADRMRPRRIDEILGQEHLLGIDGPLRAFFETLNFHSMIFWGPPGTGKTTIANIIAKLGDYEFIKISAVDSGVKELRQIIQSAQIRIKKNRLTLLFIDEIHRFNKTQQDGLLHAVEKGIIILIGATTENPSFEVNAALLSRCQVYKLENLSRENIRILIDRTINNDAILAEKNIEIEDYDFLIDISGGDARTTLNALELASGLAGKNFEGKTVLDRKLFEKALQRRTAQYDKKGESHYDTISAFIKSLRGSDPDAALLWLAKMLDAGEEPRFIARRMLVFASEDIGNAVPTAISVALAVFQAVEVLGYPECRITLAQGVTYLASCPKSNASYIGISEALEIAKKNQPLIVPLHLRNAPTEYMKSEGYGADYKYPHDFEGHFIEENYFPVSLKQKALYRPNEIGAEVQIKKRLESLWKERY